MSKNRLSKWYHLISVIYDKSNGKIWGFRILDVDKKKFKDVNLGDLQNLDFKNTDWANFRLTPSGNLEGVTDGDIAKMPKVYKYRGETVCFSNDTVIVLGEIIQTHLVEGKEVWGYRVTDYTGDIYDFTLDKFLEYQSVGYYNADVIVDRDNGNKVRVVPITSEFDFRYIIKAVEIPKSVVDKTNEMLKKAFPNVDLGK